VAVIFCISRSPGSPLGVRRRRAVAQPRLPIRNSHGVLSSAPDARGAGNVVKEHETALGVMTQLT
jgi:hypothetical protein